MTRRHYSCCDASFKSHFSDFSQMKLSTGSLPKLLNHCWLNKKPYSIILSWKQKMIMTSIQTYTGFYGCLWFIWWLISYNNAISFILLHWSGCKDAREDTEDRLTGLILEKLILGWPGERQCVSAWCVKEQSGFTCAIQGHLVSAWPSGRWDNLPEFPINHPQKSLLPAIYARAPSSEPVGK